MLHEIKKLLAPVVTEGATRQLQKTLYPILGVAALSVGAVVLMGTLLGWYGVTLNLLIILFSLIMVLLVLNHKGEVRIPSIVLPIATLSTGSYIAAINTGILDEAMWAMPATIALAGLLMGRRGVVIFSGLALVVTSAIGIGNVSGILASNLPFGIVGAGESAALMDNLKPLITVETIIVVDIFLTGVGALTYIIIDNLAKNIERAQEAAEEIRNRTRELEASQRVTFAASEHINPNDFLDLVVNLIRDQFDLYHAQVYMIDETREHAVLQQSTGYAGRVLLQRGHSIPLDATSLVTRTIATREPVLVDDVTQDEGHLPNPLLPETRTELVVPLKREGQVIGVLDAQDRVRGRFGPSTVSLFQTMADQVAILFENNELMEGIAAQTTTLTLFTNQLRTAADIARRLTQIRDPERLLQEVVELIQSRFDLYHTHIYLLDEKCESLILRIGAGEVGRVLRARGHAIPLHAERSLVARAARDQATIRVNDTDEVAGFLPNPLLPDTRSELAIPLLISNRLLGVLDMQHQAVGHFSDANRDTFNTLAGQIAVALENAELFEQQTQARQALAENEQRYRSIVEYSHAGVLITDGDFHLTYANAQLAEISGYTVDELVGMDFRNLLTQESLAFVADYYTRRRRGENVPDRYDFTFVRKNGEVRDAQMSVSVVMDEQGELRTIAQVLDITERKTAEEERARFTHQLRTAAQIAGEISAILNPTELLSAMITQLKERFDLYHAHYYAYSDREKTLTLEAGYGEAGAHMLAQGDALSFDDKRSPVAQAARTQEPVIVNDVTSLTGYARSSLLPDTRSEVAIPVIAAGELLGVLDVHDDEANTFTEGDLNVFMTLAGQIATAVENAMLFEEIQQTADRLRELDRLKSEFLANMSHELRTPLNSIIGYAEIMLMGIDGDIDPEIEQDIQGIFDNGQHLLHLINDILDLAKIEAGRLTLNKAQVNLGRLLEEVRAHNTGLLASKPLTVHIEAEPGLPEVLGDPMRLNQVVNNLLSNAIKFTDEGHVKLRAYQEDGHVCVAVEDTGVGIAEAHFDIIFERFRQADGSASRPQEGTGLGLAITRHLVEMHGGTIDVQSQLGEGSVFTVRLPILSEISES